MLRVRYRYRQSLLSLFLHVFEKLLDTNQRSRYGADTPGVVVGSVAKRETRPEDTRKNLLKMLVLFEERFCELVRTLKHLDDVTSQRQIVTTEQLGGDWKSGGLYNINDSEQRPLVFVLFNIHPTVMDAWKDRFIA